MVEIDSPAHASTKVNYALPRCLSDEPPREKLEEFREWIKKGLVNNTLQGERPARYIAEYETLDKPHHLGFIAVKKKSWFYELATSHVWLWGEHIDVAFYYLRKKIMQFPELVQRKVTTVDTFFSTKIGALWHVYKKSPDNFDWKSCDSLIKIIRGVCVECGLSWFDVNTLLIPMHLEYLKHWILVKLDLLNWTIEVYDSLHHEGPHNSKVQEALECMSKFIPMLADRIDLFKFKPRDHPRTYPIPVIIMQDIPRQENGDDCGIFTIKCAECLIEGMEVHYWIIQGRMHIFREWLTCYLWCHAKKKIEDNYKSDEEEPPRPPTSPPPPPPHEVHMGVPNSTFTDQGRCSWDNAVMPESQSSAVPQRNMEFSSEEEAYEFYKNYAEQNGFKVRKGKVQRTSDGNVPHTSDGKAPINKRTFLCSKEGKRSKKVQEKTPKYERKKTRTGCKAEIRIELKNGKWVIYSCSLEHNHAPERPGQTNETDICPDNSQVIARESTGDGAHVEDKEGGTAENRGPEKVRVSNYLPDKNVAELPPEDIRSLLNCFSHLQAEDRSFFYAIQLNSENQMTGFFWSDGRSSIDYAYFADLLVLDTCRYQMDNNVICAPFFGVNHHRDPVLFGCAFLLEETEESFRWLFRTFLKAMGYSQPKTLFTALSEDIARAAEKEFPETKHLIVKQFILWELSDKLLPTHLNNCNIRDKLACCVREDLSKQEFEERWNLLMEECELREHPWLAIVYKLREKWSHLFREVLAFPADLELLIIDLDDYFDIFPEWFIGTPSEIFEEYLEATEEFRSRELSEDFKSNSMQCREIIGMAEHAADVYTRSVLSNFEWEFKRIMSLAMEEVSPGPTCVYKLKDFRGSGNEEEVRFHCSSSTVSCSCKKFEMEGILCSHSLRVLHGKNIFRIPEQYVLKRWTRSAKQGVEVKGNSDRDNTDEKSRRLHSRNLMYKALNVITKSEATKETREIVERHLDLALQETEVAMTEIMTKHAWEKVWKKMRWASSSDDEVHGS